MAGVEILSQTPIMADKASLIVAAVVFIALLIVSEALMMYFDAEEFEFVVSFACAFVTLMIFGLYSGMTKYETGRYEYKVTIDDSVSMVEFLEKYEIVSQEGKIYTIRDVEVQDD